MGIVISTLVDLVRAYCSKTYVSEPKNADVIFVKDFRCFENGKITTDKNTGVPQRKVIPDIFVLDSNLTQVVNK